MILFYKVRTRTYHKKMVKIQSYNNFTSRGSENTMLNSQSQE